MNLLTGILPNGYNPPEGFCWDQLCHDPPIRDDPDLEDYNVDDVVTRFLTIANAQVRTPSATDAVRCVCEINRPSSVLSYCKSLAVPSSSGFGV